MRLYHVVQVLVQTRIVEIEASNKAEAEKRAADGYGEVVERDSTSRLLSAKTEYLGPVAA